MKLIKILITMTLLNTIFVMGLVRYAANKPLELAATEQSMVETSGLDTQTILSKSPDPTITPTKKPNATKTPVATKAPTKTVTPITTTTPKPTVAPTAKATPTPTPTPAAASGCIVTVDGASYNITSLVKSHSGGNVFKCGTDMSSTFNGASPRHKISWMTKYKI